MRRVEKRNVSLSIFITSVSGSKSLTYFTNRIFHLSRPPGFRMAFDAAERNKRFGRTHCQRRKESSSRGIRRVFSAEKQWESKSSQRTFGKLNKGGRSLGQKTGEKGTDRRIGR